MKKKNIKLVDKNKIKYMTLWNVYQNFCGYIAKNKENGKYFAMNTNDLGYCDYVDEEDETLYKIKKIHNVKTKGVFEKITILELELEAEYMPPECEEENYFTTKREAFSEIVSCYRSELI